MFIKIIQYIKNKLRGEQNINDLVKKGLKIGNNFSKQGQVIIDPSHCWLISIGNNVTLAARVYILAHDASTKRLTNYTKIGLVKIGDNVFVGANSIILPNVFIGNNVIIAAGSVVTKSIPNNSLVAGNPARIISTTSDYVEKHNKNLEHRPIFDESWTDRKKISKEMKDLMIKRLEDGIGYID